MLVSCVDAMLAWIFKIINDYGSFKKTLSRGGHRTRAMFESKAKNRSRIECSTLIRGEISGWLFCFDSLTFFLAMVRIALASLKMCLVSAIASVLIISTVEESFRYTLRRT